VQNTAHLHKHFNIIETFKFNVLDIFFIAVKMMPIKFFTAATGTTTVLLKLLYTTRAFIYTSTLCVCVCVYNVFLFSHIFSDLLSYSIGGALKVDVIVFGANVYYYNIPTNTTRHSGQSRQYLRIFARDLSYIMFRDSSGVDAL